MRMASPTKFGTAGRMAFQLRQTSLSRVKLMSLHACFQAWRDQIARAGTAAAPRTFHAEGPGDVARAHDHAAAAAADDHRLVGKGRMKPASLSFLLPNTGAEREGETRAINDQAASSYPGE